MKHLSLIELIYLPFVTIPLFYWFEATLAMHLVTVFPLTYYHLTAS